MYRYIEFLFFEVPFLYNARTCENIVSITSIEVKTELRTLKFTKQKKLSCFLNFALVYSMYTKRSFNTFNVVIFFIIFKHIELRLYIYINRKNCKIKLKHGLLE